MKKPAGWRASVVVLGFAVLMTVKHYVVLGAYLGAIFFVVQLFRQYREVEKAFAQSHGWEVIATVAAFAGLLLGCVLFCAGIGWLIGRTQADSKKR